MDRPDALEGEVAQAEVHGGLGVTDAQTGGEGPTGVGSHSDLGATSTDQLVILLSDVLLGCFGPQRDQQVTEFDLYLAALRRPALRPVADQYTERTVEALAHYADPVTATAAAAAMNGLTLSGPASTRGPPTGPTSKPSCAAS